MGGATPRSRWVTAKPLKARLRPLPAPPQLTRRLMAPGVTFAEPPKPTKAEDESDESGEPTKYRN